MGVVEMIALCRVHIRANRDGVNCWYLVKTEDAVATVVQAVGQTEGEVH